MQFVKLLCQFTKTGGVWHRNLRGKELIIGLPSMSAQVHMKKMNIDSKYKWKILIMSGITKV